MKQKSETTQFQKFEAMARQVFTTPKAAVAKALEREKRSRAKRRKAG